MCGTNKHRYAGFPAILSDAQRVRHGGNAQARCNPGRRCCRLQPARGRGRRPCAGAAPGNPQRSDDPIIAVHNGRVVKRTGDGAIVEFRSVVDAVRLAIEVQHGTLVFDEDRDHVWEDAWKHRTEHLCMRASP